jgi:hypothetical protein
MTIQHHLHENLQEPIPQQLKNQIINKAVTSSNRSDIPQTPVNPTQPLINKMYRKIIKHEA